jgi:hypothetical protein
MDARNKSEHDNLRIAQILSHLQSYSGLTEQVFELTLAVIRTDMQKQYPLQ